VGGSHAADGTAKEATENAMASGQRADDGDNDAGDISNRWVNNNYFECRLWGRPMFCCFKVMILVRRKGFFLFSILPRNRGRNYQIFMYEFKIT